MEEERKMKRSGKLDGRGKKDGRKDGREMVELWMEEERYMEAGGERGQHGGG